MSIINLKCSIWVFKDTIDFTGFEDFDFEINLTTWNPVDDYSDSSNNHFIINTKENKLFCRYVDGDSVYEFNIYDGTTWLNEKCKTIVFANGKDKTNKHLISFLEKNATLIKKVSNLKNSKWLLNETLDSHYFDDELYIKSNNQIFTYIYREDGYGLEYGDENDNYTLVYDDETGWVNQAYRTIEVLDCELLKYDSPYIWLLKNATLLEEQPMTVKEYLTDVADAIRETGCLTEKINGQDFVDEIKGIRTVKKLLDCTRSAISLFDRNLNSNNGYGDINSVIAYDDTENVVLFDYMFNHNRYISKIPLLNTSKAIRITSMFNGCESIRELPPFDFSNVQEMSHAFSFCKQLQTIILNNSNATIMQYTFWTCYQLSKIDITKLADDNAGCFRDCRSLTKLIIRTMDTIPTFGVVMLENCYHMSGTTNTTYNPEGLKDGRIYVPDDKVEELKAATGWSDYADIIVPLSTLDGETSDTTIITFTLGNIGTFEAEEGMTWQQWISSSYNTEGTFVFNGNVIGSAGANVQYNGVNVKETDTIIANATYQLYMDMGDF